MSPIPIHSKNDAMKGNSVLVFEGVEKKHGVLEFFCFQLVYFVEVSSKWHASQ